MKNWRKLTPGRRHRMRWRKREMESKLRRGVRIIERHKDRLIRRDKLIAIVKQYFPAGPVLDVG